ncbi:hypothetical protein BW723_04740 [Polaribacter reichenbachii]|uniref:Uncharacterized protein n=1 Tax=Polaribacter reichenbachii TaxID=996801 RepID=A0A1B8TUU3_9FLAO|nr:hypothetical protein [Polaribacter reichenbachii]APZ45646.1 hypothetical protein BW723_04740 [Polaribacter reichenbachii]AUC19508.1 hypothetical protein BTO17_12745 [Polaribacter reichenbachii]OBY63338.1 hypothetical protein LPB301_10970 [Polaribacter reichenbachii]
MNKSIKLILLIIGIILCAYGVYTIVQPETQVSIGDLDLLEAQDNTNAYVILALGVVAVALSLIKGK